MKLIIKSLFTLIILSACNGNKGQNMDDKNGKQNQFSSRDSAVASILQSLPQILNNDQKKLYNLSDQDLKSLTPGMDVAVRFISFDDIMNSKDSDLTNLLPKEASTFIIPLGMNNVSRLFIILKNDKNNWQIQSIGNRRFMNALRDPQNAGNNEVVSIPGLEIALLRKQDTSGVVYTPLETNTKAALDKNTQYSEEIIMQKLKVYAAVLSRQFGDKLKTGEIDR